MQLFMPFENFSDSAEALDDLRLNKQILECAQIASTAFWLNDCSLGEKLTAQGHAYLPSHEHHQLCIWAAQCPENLRYVVGFGLVCWQENYYRKNTKHNSYNYLCQMLFARDKMKRLSEPSSQPNATTNSKHFSDLHQAYRNELCLRWQNDKTPPTWTKRKPPRFWFTYLLSQVILAVK